MKGADRYLLDQVRELKKLLDDAEEMLAQVRRGLASLEMRLSEDDDRGERSSLWTRGRG